MKIQGKHTSDNEAMPTTIKPMLATLVKQAFTDDDYIFEVKWDGYRIIAFCNNGEVRLASRGGEDYTLKYPSIVQALKALNCNCVIDGEIVYVNSAGKPDFDQLQRVNGQRSPIIYYAFDLLWLDGKNIMKEKLLARKELLKSLVKDHLLVRFSELAALEMMR